MKNKKMTRTQNSDQRRGTGRDGGNKKMNPFGITLPQRIPPHSVPGTRTCKQVTLKGVKGVNKLTILLVSMIVLAIAVFVVAQTEEELEQELGALIQGLEGAGYEWLTDYPVINKYLNINYLFIYRNLEFNYEIK